MRKFLPLSWMTPSVITFRVLWTCLVFVPNCAIGSDDQILKKILEPCEIVFSQAHCSDDDEDYPTSDECFLAKTDNCNGSMRLSCISSVCLPNCHPQAENYDPEKGKCLRKIGADCKVSTDCEQNANCERKQCRCSPNFALEQETGKCIRAAEYGEYCDSEITCDKVSDMECMNNRCECKSPDTQFYNPKRKRCYIYIGYNCTGGLKFCPDDSNCLRELQKNETLADDTEQEEHYIGIPFEDESKVFKCKCNKGYAPSEDMKACTGLHGAVCNSLHKCNTNRSLKCYNGTCLCARPQAQVYDPVGQKCLTFSGKLCNPQKESCVDWAECKSTSSESNDIHVSDKCECISGFMSTPDGICLKAHGQRCNPDLDLEDEPFCNIFVGLECSNYTRDCQCKEPNQFFDTKRQVCRDFVVAGGIPATPFNESDREYNFHTFFSRNGGVKINKVTAFEIVFFVLAAYVSG